MTDTVIRAEDLSKRYRIGQRERYKSLRDDLSSAFAASFRRLSSLFGHPSPDNDQRRKISDDHIWALKGVSFEVKQGEVVGIIGRNGAGKSTLLKIFSRITEPTKGRVEIRGRVVSLLEVGTGFHPELTGRENIYLNGIILGMRKAEIERKFDEIVAFAEIEKFIDTPVKHYSSGMYVRLAFAVAAHLEPEILLIDEILAVGDAAFQRKCLDKIEGVSREGRTTLFVSHNMSAVASLCQRGILLAEGRIALDDTADKVVVHYLSMTREHQLPVEGKVSLVNHPGRRKVSEGLLRLTYFKLLTGEQQSAKYFRSGGTVRFVIGYEMTSLLENINVVFALNFNDAHQRRLFYCSSEVVGYDFRGISQVGEVQCIIPKLPLFPGSYTINVGCRVGNVWSDGVYEAIEFEVVGGDFYSTGQLPPEGVGNLLVEHYWTVGSEQ